MGVGREQGRHARLRNDHQRGRARGPRHGPTGRSDQSPAEHNSCGVPSQRQPDRGRWRLGLGDRRGRVGGTYRPDDRQTASDPGRRLPGLGDHLRRRCGVGARRARRTIGPARGALRLAARSTNPSPLRPDCGASERRQRSGCRGGVGVGGQPLGRAGIRIHPGAQVVTETVDAPGASTVRFDQPAGTLWVADPLGRTLRRIDPATDRTESSVEGCPDHPRPWHFVHGRVFASVINAGGGGLTVRPPAAGDVQRSGCQGCGVIPGGVRTC